MLAYGVGRNDADYPVTVHEVIDGRSRMTWKCPIYTVWRSMLTRCFSEKYHIGKPTYVGCTVDTSWHSFSVFRQWVLTQDWQGKQLDKDILVPGNKVYSPDTCCFISWQINVFLTDSTATRGEYPIGASWKKRIGKFQSRCGNPHTKGDDYLGVFHTADQAHMAWATQKLKHAEALASEQSDARVADALVRRFTAIYETAKVVLTDSA